MFYLVTSLGSRKQVSLIFYVKTTLYAMISCLNSNKVCIVWKRPWQNSWPFRTSDALKNCHYRLDKVSSMDDWTTEQVHVFFISHFFTANETIVFFQSKSMFDYFELVHCVNIFEAHPLLSLELSAPEKKILKPGSAKFTIWHFALLHGCSFHWIKTFSFPSSDDHFTIEC